MRTTHTHTLARPVIAAFAASGNTRSAGELAICSSLKGSSMHSSAQSPAARNARSHVEADWWLLRTHVIGRLGDMPP